MNFLLWLSQKMDALVENKRQIALGALGLAALAALVYLVPLMLEGGSRQDQERAPPNVVTKPLGPPAPAAVQAPEPAPEKEPVKQAAAAVPSAPAPASAPEPARPRPPAPVAAAAPAADATYQVQLGAFREEARAERLARRVQRAGFETYVVGVDLPDGRHFYRVRLKPELSHDDARQLLAQLQKKMPKQTPIVVRSGG